MNNLARKDALDEEIVPFLGEFALVSDAAELKSLGNGFLGRFPPQRRLEIASVLTWSNPFFLADIPVEAAQKLKLNLDQFAEFVMRAKLTASRARQLNVLVACAPKSASTFIENALRKALGLPSVSLFTATPTAFAGTTLGANLREQEADELALIRSGLNGLGYVAQHHMRCTPYFAQMMGIYNIRPIVTHRNLFDTIVSLDDMVMTNRTGEALDAQKYFGDGLPANYARLDVEDRLTILAQRNAAWFIQFFVSWKKCERAGLIKPLWISYEQDFLGDKAVLAARVSRHLGTEFADPVKLADAFEDKRDADARRFNKGVAGRGREMPESVREIILKTAGYYRDEEDISPLIGD
ncbi:hypothetical protein IHQ71_06915 [Rhizobium sp. TH2]|uniref:hypothetical protein n=1 Tax=Rhizobium sp. TH2 TaxID=2775403 RepID=UPI0021589118|nr:hypothetical protein [Rhizobium sp. TH2]UVC10329.1 hypothetical protein IHQ71_06915 [Rhizobium sp. TH2]